VRGTKRKRLDHLTWEEKLQRKKLKNRVAAQTSRDRKKAKMEEMESTIVALKEDNTNLQTRCDSLQEQNNRLVTKNTELEKRLAELERKFEMRSTEVKKEKKTYCDVGCETITDGSAVSNYPLQQGIVSQATPESVQQQKQQQTTNSLWKIIALCLLYKTCSEISTCLDLKSLPKAYLKISPQNWKMILKQAASELPKMKAPQSECLDQWWGPQQKSWNPAKISIEV
jgi:X box-binding protein 1